MVANCKKTCGLCQSASTTSPISSECGSSPSIIEEIRYIKNELLSAVLIGYVMVFAQALSIPILKKSNSVAGRVDCADQIITQSASFTRRIHYVTMIAMLYCLMLLTQ
ncbi:hypothetical protein DICVIV_14315 [Dictyocaulus viviparus]|uniref:ShKT domain-containing protein n=1 Tax=Dictyocaulus viviparus TaxID=29172 RepID=A0A0D8XBF6_DICVI|nr:hypothetical protein DICVIV_14315 [Dictyocaulus viviparus]